MNVDAVVKHTTNETTHAEIAQITIPLAHTTNALTVEKNTPPTANSVT
jgi:hypothetical protein